MPSQQQPTPRAESSGRSWRGLRIAKASWGVLTQHPMLLIFPVISGVALIAVSAAISLAVNLGAESGVGQHLSDNARSVITIVIGFGWYYACTFTVIFFNAALISCVLQYMAGEHASVRAGLAAAGRRLPQILGWALIATIVGTLLQILHTFLEDKLGFIGSLIGGIADTAWAVVTYFVVPTLVVEGVGPVKAVGRSSAILRRTWGESLTGAGGLGLIEILLMLPAVGFGIAAFNAHGAAAVGLAAIAVLYALVAITVFSTLSAIFRAGVYTYGTTGTVAADLDPNLVQQAFRAKT